MSTNLSADDLADAPNVALSLKDATWTWCLLKDCAEDPQWCGHNQEQAARVQMIGVWDSSGRQRWLDLVEEYGPLTDATPAGAE
jgi:hypothetical protein